MFGAVIVVMSLVVKENLREFPFLLFADSLAQNITQHLQTRFLFHDLFKQKLKNIV